MKKLAICLDGVIRNTFDQFDTLYRKKYIKNPGIVQMTQEYTFAGEEAFDEAEEKRLEALINQKIHLPMSTYDLRNHYEFESTEEFHKFLYEEVVAQVFGFADQFPFSMETANRIQNMGEALNLYETTLVCSGQHQAVSATYRFLNAKGCKIKNVTFINTPDKIWEKFDCVITDNPDILSSRPEGKLTVKIKSLYNESIPANMELINLKSIVDKEMENLLTINNI